MTITEQQMAEVIPQVVGRYTDVDGAYGNQCWDSAARIAQLLGLPIINTGGAGRWPGWAGNMVDAFPQSPAIAAAYELLPPEATVLPADTLVWGDSYKEWYPKTHVANAVKQESNGWILCLSQNSSAPRPDLPGYSPDSSGPTILQHLPKRGLIGIIRPRTGGVNPQSSTTTPKEGSFMADLTEAEQREVLLNVRKLVKAADDEKAFDAGVNEKVDELVGNSRKTFWNSEESKLRLQAGAPAQIALQINAAGIAADVRNELVKLMEGN